MGRDNYDDMPPKSGKIVKTDNTIVDEGQTIDDNAYPSTPTTTAVTLINSSEEKTYVIPAGTKQLAIKLRGQNVAFTYAWTSAQLTAGQITIAAGVVRTIINVRLGGTTIFFTAGTGTQVFEIETWA